MSDKALYILAGFDDGTGARLCALQSKLYSKGFRGVHTKNIPQHITLGSFPSEMENELTEKVRVLSNTVETFEVSFHHIGLFPGSKVLFAAPGCNEQLLKLKENFGGSFGWTPHATILIDEPGVILKAVPIVLEEFTPFCGKVTSLHLYEFFPARHILSANLKQ